MHTPLNIDFLRFNIILRGASAKILKKHESRMQLKRDFLRLQCERGSESENETDLPDSGFFSDFRLDQLEFQMGNGCSSSNFRHDKS